MKKLLLLFLFLFLFAGCTCVKTVAFNSPVDTTKKAIQFQNKKTYHLETLNVYASNEFDGARLNSFEKLNDSTANVIIYPENTPINNSPYYSFKTWSNTVKPFYYTFKYPAGFKHRYHPKIEKDGKWFQIDSSNIFINDTIVTIKLDLNTTPQTISAQEIQSSSDVKNWYSQLLTGKESYVKLESVGKTILGRNIPVLNINIGNPKGKEVIVLITRQHPPEVTGYYAFQYFLETILGNSELSKAFLNKYHVLAFPIMNPDGVDMGHWRHNVGGVDTNRDWSVYNQPEIKQVVKYISKIVKKNDAKIVLGLDFHSTWYDVFYTNKIREGTTLPNFIEDWFTGLEGNIPNYKVNEEASNSTKPVSKGWFLYGHNATGITYEIGDTTPKKDIKLIGKVSAEQMMKILTQTIIN